ncbi:MAG: hypothetical protein RI560_12435 [Natronomonas sp.]|nr:hypothetical protein [Natronomonas sp.]
MNAQYDLAAGSFFVSQLANIAVAAWFIVRSLLAFSPVRALNVPIR